MPVKKEVFDPNKFALVCDGISSCDERKTDPLDSHFFTGFGIKPHPLDFHAQEKMCNCNAKLLNCT